MNIRNGSLVLSLSCLLVSATSPAFARGNVEYDCPDLHNERKRTIEPLNQGYDGWFFRDNDLRMDFSISPETLGYFKRLDQALQKKGISLVMLPLLSRAMMADKMVNLKDPWQENYNVSIAQSSYQDFVKALQDGGVDTISLAPLFKTYQSADPYKYNFKHDIHWKPEGARLVAEETASYLMKYSGYSDLEKVNTVTHKGNEVGRSGTMMDEIQRLCVGNIGAEPFEIYAGERVTDKSEDALFGDAGGKVPVAMVGTSFSAVEEFNFANFLEENSKVAIANFSIAGGEIFTSLLSYLSSPFFHQNKPPVLLWETQAVYDFNKGTQQEFRQAIAAVEGPCSKANVIAHTALDIDGVKEAYPVFTGMKGKNISGVDYYLYIHSDNLAFRAFTLDIDYDDEDGEWFPVQRGDRFNNKGDYYIELSDRLSGRLDKITLRNASNVRTKLDVTVCKKEK